MSLLRIGVLASGRGTSLTSLIEAINKQTLPAQISLIITNKKDAPILAHQQKYGIKTLYIESKEKSRIEHEQLITKKFQEHKIDLVLLVGYMRILSKTFVDTWKDKIFNVHPSLLPDFANMMDLNVHRAVLAAKKEETGCTVHFVAEEVDGGSILLQKHCQVLPTDTPETLKAKVQKLEGEALVELVKKFILLR